MEEFIIGCFLEFPVWFPHLCKCFPFDYLAIIKRSFVELSILHTLSNTLERSFPVACILYLHSPRERTLPLVLSPQFWWGSWEIGVSTAGKSLKPSFKATSVWLWGFFHHLAHPQLTILVTWWFHRYPRLMKKIKQI